MDIAALLVEFLMMYGVVGSSSQVTIMVIDDPHGPMSIYSSGIIPADVRANIALVALAILDQGWHVLALINMHGLVWFVRQLAPNSRRFRLHAMILVDDHPRSSKNTKSGSPRIHIDVLESGGT